MVLSRQPARHAVAAARTAPVVVGFSQPITAASAAGLRVYGGQRQGRRAGNLSGGGTAMLTFTPSQGYAPGEALSVSVPASLAGTGGGAVARQVYQFTAATGGAGRGFFLDTARVGNTSSRDQVLGDLDNDGDLDLVTTGALFGCRVFLNDGTGKYAFKTGFLAGEVPAGVALTDVNQDGFLDVLVGDSKNNLLAVRLNEGTGDFSLPTIGYQNAPVGAGPASIATGDVDGDGDLDFVTANTAGNSATVWLNSGSYLPSGYYFTSSTTISMGAGPTAVALADIDNDGDLDLLTTNAGTSANPFGEVHVSRNSGTGTFGAYAAVAVGLQPAELALGDLDNDGDLDLLTANAGAASVSVRLNSGTGTFTGTTTLALPAGSTPSGLRPGDVDADGDLDLVVAQGTGGRVFTYLNAAGTLTLQSRALRLSRDAPLASVGVTLGDVDGDGDLDVVTSDDQGNVLLSRNVGPPPALPAPVITGLTPDSGPVGTPVTLTGTALTDVAGVFFNGVAAPGFVLNGSGTSLSVAVPAGAGSGPLAVATEDAGTATAPGAFTVTIPVPVLLTSVLPTRNAPAAPVGSTLAATFTAAITAATAGNVRGFGSQWRGRRPGSLTGAGSRTLTFDPDQDFMPGEQVSISLPASLQAPDGNAVRKQVVQFTAAAGGTGRHDFFLTSTLAMPGTGPVQLGDIDNDGDLDLVAGGPAGLVLRLNTGAGTFAANTTQSSPSAANFLAMGDLDADGDLDLISASAAGSGVGWLGNGRGAFANAGTLVLPARGYLSQLTLADVDADGDLDLLALANDQVSVLLNGGQGTFTKQQDSYFSITALDMALGDIDNDGDLDLVLPGRNSSRGLDQVVVALNDGNGYFETSAALTLSADAVQQVALADLDNDGDLDLATQSYVGYANQVTTRRNDGSGHFGAALATLPLAAADLLLADTDADGDLDVLTPLGVGLNDGTGRLAELVAPYETAGATALAVGDVDNDGDLDLLTNDPTGTVRVRLNRPGPPPALAGRTPGSGPVGSRILLTGTNLATTSTVTFNGLAAGSFTVISATQVVATVPAGATSGPVVLATPAGTATAPGGFSVTQPLALAALSPARNTPNAAPPTALSLRFAQPVAPASAAELRVFGSQHGRLAGTVAGGGTATLTFTPAQPLAAGEEVSVSIPDRLAGLDGSRAVRQGSQFRVAAGGTGTGLLLAGPAGRTIAAYNARYAFAVGDLDQDGDPDVVTTEGVVRYNDGTGAFPDSTNGPWFATSHARRVALADLDSDGDLDVISTNGEVLLNTGRARFSRLPASPGLGEQVRDLALGDLDSDGDLDLVVPNYARDSVYVLFNNGAGRFTARLRMAVGSRPAGLSLGDIDNDGDLDLVTANEGTAGSSLSIGFNNGIGWFEDVRTLAAGTGLGRVVLGDLDGDHDLDLVTNNGLVRLNDGTGTFGGTQTTASGQGLALADLDADGDLDLVVTGPGSSAVRRNDGTGQLGGTETVALGAASQGHDPVLADLDGDGDLDLLTGNATTGTVLLALNERLAPPALLSFAPASGLPGAVVVLAGTDFIGTTGVTLNGVVAPAFTVVTASRLEVRVPAGASTGLLEVTNARGTARSATAFVVLRPVAVTSLAPAANAIAPATAVVSATFAQPIITSTAANLVVFSQQRGGQLAGTRGGAGSPTLTFTPAQPYLPGEVLSVSLPPYTDASQQRVVRQVYQFTAATGGNGRGVFSEPTLLRNAGSPQPILGDIDGDGDLDLLYVYQNRVQLQRNDGRGTFAEPLDLLRYPYSGSYADNLALLKLGDVDGDGDLDLAISDQDKASTTDTAVVHIQLNDGRGGFAAAADVPVDASPAEMTLADLDADGDLDLYTTNTNSYGTSTYSATASVRLNDGRGHFQATPNQRLVSLSSRFYRHDPVMGDVDGDGDLDLIADESIRGRVYFNDGQGRFTQGSDNLLLTSDVTALALRDVDNDGDLDLLQVRVNTGLGVLLNDGRGHFPTFIESGSPYSYDGFELMDVGDLDADGDLDVLLTSSRFYEYSRVMLNDGRGSFVRAAPLILPYPNQGGLNPAPALGDLDGDGDLDLVCNTQYGLVTHFNGPGKPLATSPPVPLAPPVSVYPNPAHGQFTLGVPATLRPAAGSLQLYNALGQLVLEQPLHLSASGEQAVDVARLPTGLYTLRLALSSGPATYKISVY